MPLKCTWTCLLRGAQLTETHPPATRSVGAREPKRGQQGLDQLLNEQVEVTGHRPRMTRSGKNSPKRGRARDRVLGRSHRWGGRSAQSWTRSPVPEPSTGTGPCRERLTSVGAPPRSQPTTASSAQASAPSAQQRAPVRDRKSQRPPSGRGRRPCHPQR